jgi:anti-sigma factor RsiW
MLTDLSEIPAPCQADPEETAEAFVMKRMDPSDASAYEEHLAHCQACAKIVEMTRAFVQAMRDAARQLADDDKKAN